MAEDHPVWHLTIDPNVILDQMTVNDQDDSSEDQKSTTISHSIIPVTKIQDVLLREEIKMTIKDSLGYELLIIILVGEMSKEVLGILLDKTLEMKGLLEDFRVDQRDKSRTKMMRVIGEGIDLMIEIMNEDLLLNEVIDLVVHETVPEMAHETVPATLADSVAPDEPVPAATPVIDLHETLTEMLLEDEMITEIETVQGETMIDEEVQGETVMMANGEKIMTEIMLEGRKGLNGLLIKNQNLRSRQNLRKCREMMVGRI